MRCAISCTPPEGSELLCNCIDIDDSESLYNIIHIDNYQQHNVKVRYIIYIIILYIYIYIYRRSK